MPANVKAISNLGTKSRLEALRVQLVAGEKAVRIGQRIKRRRMELGLNQRELAQRLGTTAVDNQRISDWERGIHKPSDRYMSLLATALERDEAWFHASEQTETPELFASEVQVADVRDEFTKHVEELNRKLSENQQLLKRILDKLVTAEMAEATKRLADRAALDAERPSTSAQSQDDQDSEKTG